MADSSATILAEVQTDLRWITKTLERTGQSVLEIEGRVGGKVEAETASRKVDHAALVMRVEACEKQAETARTAATEARDSARRVLWVGATVLATATGVAAVTLKLLFDLASQLKVVP